MRYLAPGLVLSFGSFNLTPAGAPLGEARTFFSSVATRGGRVAAFATFKKDTTLERQGEFTLSTLQGGARAGERLNEPNDKPQEDARASNGLGIIG